MNFTCSIAKLEFLPRARRGGCAILLLVFSVAAFGRK